MDALQRLEREELLYSSRIATLDDLKDVLNAQQTEILDSIQRLAISDKPEDTAARSRLLGKLELANNLLKRISE